MAVDSRDKRASAAGSEWDVIYPNPSGDLDTAAQRSHMAGLYAMAAATPPFTAVYLLASYRARVDLSATYDGSPELTASYRTRVELEGSQ